MSIKKQDKPLIIKILMLKDKFNKDKENIQKNKHFKLVINQAILEINPLYKKISSINI